MEQFITQFLIVTGIQMLALMSPGPDFAMVSKMAITHNRKIGMYTALGIAFGITVHVAYSLLGIGYLMMQSILLFNVVKYVGAAYLIYIGAKALFAKRVGKEIETVVAESNEFITNRKAILTGFLTNVLNPKATLFMFSLFTQVIGPATPMATQLVYGVMIFATTLLWFMVVASAWSMPFVSKRIKRIQPIVERGMGAVLIALGIKIVLPSSK